MRQIRIRSLLCLFILLTGSATAPALEERVDVIQRFEADSSLEAWKTVDRATMSCKEGRFELMLPKYDGSEYSWPRAERDVRHWNFSDFNGVQITVENPTDATQRLDLVMKDGRGTDGYLSESIAPHAKRTVRLRFADAYNDPDWSDIRMFAIMRTQPEVDYLWRVEEVSLFTDAPDRTPRAAAEVALARADEAFKNAKPMMNADQTAAMEQKISGWREQVKAPDGLRGKLEAAKVELAAVAADAFGIKAANDAKNQADPTLLAWSVVPGQTFRPSETMLQYRQPAGQVSIHAARGEYGDTILRLSNVGPATEDLRITIKPLETSSLPALTVRQNVPVLGRDGTRSGDALVPLDSAGLVTLPAGETAELWFRADVRHQQWPAGTHRFTIEARDLRKPKAPVTAIGLDVVILNVDLNAARPMRAHFWPEMSHSRSWIVHGREQAAWDNMVDYGANVVTVVGTDIPWPKFTAEGEIESLDFAQADRTLAFYRKNASPMLLFWLDMDTSSADNWSLRAGLQPGSPAWRRALANWITAWTNHLHELGLTEKDYAFYVTDEPDRGELDRTLMFATVVKELDPKYQIYVNHTGTMWDDDAKNEQLLKLTDIWQPDESAVPAVQRQRLSSHDHIQQWIYRCSMARRSYGVNVYDYYRLMTWRAMRDGVTGIAYWTYCATHPGEDPWDGTKGEASGGILIYPDNDHGLIMSARWELVRMGLDDARYADLLRRANPKDEARNNQIQLLLHDRLNEIIVKNDRPELAAQWRIDAGRLLESMAH